VLRNPYSAPAWKTPNRPPSIKYIVHAFFGGRFVEKDGGLRTPNLSADEVRGLEVKIVNNFEHFENRSKIQA
jgi:hypothetical protein